MQQCRIRLSIRSTCCIVLDNVDAQVFLTVFYASPYYFLIPIVLRLSPLLFPTCMGCWRLSVACGVQYDDMALHRLRFLTERRTSNAVDVLRSCVTTEPSADISLLHHENLPQTLGVL